MAKDMNMKAGSAIIAFLIGSAVGVAAGLLVAPKSGKETREDIQRKAKEGFGKAKDKIGQGKDAATNKIGSIVDTTKTVVDESKRAAKEAKERINNHQAVNHG